MIRGSGWYHSASEESKDKIRRYMSTDASHISWDMIRCALSSVSRMAIIPIQDVFEDGSDKRMNIQAVHMATGDTVIIRSIS